ncbi:MAG TPA: cupin domain-containing protein [Aestuariivirgaceae bacterium]|nr:cupin domain-containing protein [Aestuariivirgaceae bacterium]
MRKIEITERLVVNIRKAAFKPFVIDGKTIDGQSFLQLDDTFPEGTGFHIYRMAPGSSSQPHEHTCHEQFLVLEGEVSDNDGYVYKPGDFVLLKTGTQHSSHSKTGATLAVFVRSAERNV